MPPVLGALPSHVAEASELTSLNSKQQLGSPRHAKAECGLACCLQIALSISLIEVNKWVMRPDHFPYAISLVLANFAFCSLIVLLIFSVKPSWFPTLRNQSSRPSMIPELLTKLSPVAISSALSFVLSNAAYSYLGIAFIQMTKQTYIVWVYLFSVICRIESLKVSNIQVIVAALVGMALTVKGEHSGSTFSWLGLFLQLGSCMWEALKITMQSWFLGNILVDPLTLVLIAMPISCLFLGLGLVVVSMLHVPMDTGFGVPPLADVWKFAPWIMTSCCLACCLNISAAFTIKRVGAMGFVFMNMCRDVVVVVMSVLFLHESIGITQAVGFVIQLLCVSAWSAMKSYPHLFGNLPVLRDEVSNINEVASQPKAEEDDQMPAKSVEA